METFYILTEAMYQSLGQAIVVYLASRAVLLTFPKLAAASRYKVLYLAHCMIFILFLMNIYSISKEWSTYAVSLKDGVLNGEPVPVRFVSLRSMIMSNAPLIGGAYFLGLILQVLFLIPGLIRLRTLTKGEQELAGIWSDKLGHWSRKLGIQRQIKLICGKRASVPFTAGFLKPIIYLPVTAFNNLTTEQAEAVLIHELAHIKRHDYLFNLIQKGIEMVMFFNPVSWVLGGEIRKEREFCCDDLVVNYTDSKLYAQALFLLEENRAGSYSLALAATGERSNTLLERIKRITQMNTNRLTLKPGIYALLGFLATGLSVAWIAPAPKQSTKTQPVSAEELLPIAEASRMAEKPKGPMIARTIVLDTIPAKDSAAVKRYFNSPEWKKQMEEVKKQSEEIRKHFDSPEWKKQMAEIQQHSREVQKHFESAEWKKHMEEVKAHSQELSKELQKQFDSPEWKKQQELMAQHAEKMKKQFESPEWKKQMQEMEKLGAEMEKKFNSPEFKEKMKAMEGEMEKKFNSPEWKEKMKKLELEGKELEKKFESPEWKKKMHELELHGKELEKKFNSPEWKKKMELLEKEAAEEEKDLKR